MSDRRTVAIRTMTWEMQERFAELSGDRNPMHMDPLAARRTYAGQPVVHGIHTLLWGLETLVEHGIVTSQLERVKVKFLKWIYPGSSAELTVPVTLQINPNKFYVEVQGLLILSAELFYEGPIVPIDELVYESAISPLLKPRDLSFTEVGKQTGEAFVTSATAASEAFPKLAQAYGARLVAEIVATSYIVGMEAPGLHSTFSSVDLTLKQDPKRMDCGLAFRVVYTDDRFHKARLRVEGAALEGMLEVFFRSPPVLQASMQEVATRIRPGEFAGMRALIIGGSRGLGEVTAKIVACGGGEVFLSYAVGKQEAEQLAHEIRSAGAHAEILAYDVRQPAAAQVATLPAKPTHLFFFATNAISQPRFQLFSPSVFAEFIQFYVSGFYDLCVALLSTQPQLRAYYPSSVFVEERPHGMAEYIMAKAAGEVLCAEMNQSIPNIDVSFTRVPRLPTDQTASFLPSRVISPVDVLIPVVRERMGHQNTGLT